MGENEPKLGEKRTKRGTLSTPNVTKGEKKKHSIQVRILIIKPDEMEAQRVSNRKNLKRRGVDEQAKGIQTLTLQKGRGKKEEKNIMKKTTVTD